MEFNGTFLVTIITFVVFVFLMNRILYAPILSIMEERKSVIDGNYKVAEDNKIRADGLLEEKEERLSVAKDNARIAYNDVVDGFKSQKSNMINNAQSSAQNELERSNIELKNVSDEVKNALKGSMTDLANDIVEKVIGYRSEVQDYDFNDDAVNKVLWDKQTNGNV